MSISQEQWSGIKQARISSQPNKHLMIQRTSLKTWSLKDMPSPTLLRLSLPAATTQKCLAAEQRLGAVLPFGKGCFCLVLSPFVFLGVLFKSPTSITPVWFIDPCASDFAAPCAGSKGVHWCHAHMKYKQNIWRKGRKPESHAMQTIPNTSLLTIST